tara:strand:+ start:176 stop:520 length:345 start_codon:yes stop_codon:yes gene_type:complete
MIYSAYFRAQVIKSIKQKDMNIRQAYTFYNITLQRWLTDPSIQTNRVKTPTSILNEALLKDVNQYPDDYLYERARRLNCSKSGIGYALKRLNISQKKDLSKSKSVSNKKGNISE